MAHETKRTRLGVRLVGWLLRLIDTLIGRDKNAAIGAYSLREADPQQETFSDRPLSECHRSHAGAVLRRIKQSAAGEGLVDGHGSKRQPSPRPTLPRGAQLA